MTQRTKAELDAFANAIGARPRVVATSPGYAPAMSGWYGREVQIGESGLGAQEGHVRESFTFYANRFSRRHFERNVREVGDQMEVKYSLDVKCGLLMCDIGVTVEGEQEQVDAFRRYAVGLSAASDGGVGGGP